MNAADVITLAAVIHQMAARQRRLEDDGRRINHDLDNRLFDYRCTLEELSTADLGAGLEEARRQINATAFVDTETYAQAIAVLEDEQTRRAYAGEDV